MNGWDVALDVAELRSPRSRLSWFRETRMRSNSHRDCAKHHDADPHQAFRSDSLLQTLSELLGLKWILVNESSTKPSRRFEQRDEKRKTRNYRVFAGAGRPSTARRDRLRARNPAEALRPRKPVRRLRWLVEKLEPMSRNLDFQEYIAGPFGPHRAGGKTMKSRYTVVVVDDSVSR